MQVDNSLPRLQFASNTLSVSKYKLLQLAEEIITPKLLTTTYNDLSTYTHQIWIVPDGKWHMDKCPESLAALQNCLMTTFKNNAQAATMESGNFFNVTTFTTG